MATPSVALLSLIVFALLGAGIVIIVQVRRDQQPRAHPVVRVRHVIGPVFLVAAIVALGVTPLGALSFDLTYQVSADPGTNEDTIPVDQPTNETFSVPIEPLFGVTYVVSGEGVSVESWDREGSTVVVSVAIPPAKEPGSYSATLHLTPYPELLPQAVLEDLHERNPLLAMLSSAGLLVPLYLLIRLLLDGDRPLYRLRNRRLRRWLGERR